MADTHYVLVIHGTWNPPNPTSPTWHQLNESDPQNFCTKLNDELERLGFGRPVWRHVDAQEISFGWSGANQDADRQKAGERLCELITHIVDRDPSARIHFVAHSHGANVLLYALSLYLETLRTKARVMVREAQLTVANADLSAALSSVTGVLPSILRGPLERIGKKLVRSLAVYLAAYTSRRKGRDITSVLETLEGVVRGKIGQDATQRLMQSLPGFNEKMFSDIWMAFDACNRIGRLVFLGSPFFKKTWNRRAWWSPGLSVGEALNLMAAMFLGLIAMFMAIEWMWAQVWLIGSLLQLVFHFDGDLRPQLDPRNWSTWLQVVGALFVIFYTILLWKESYYKKTWNRRAWWSPGFFVGETLNLMTAMFLGLIAAFMAIEWMWAQVWLIGSLLQLVFHFDGDLRPQLDPRNWSTWLQVVGALFVIFYTILLWKESYYRGNRQDVNPYFQIENVAPCSAEVSPWFPFRTQVIHAGLLDEALLGYSAEPLVYGALAPQVRSLLDPPRLLLRADRPQRGEDFSPSSKFFGFVKVPLRSLLWVVTKAAFPVGGILERRLVKMLLQIISSPAYGLPVREFLSAVYMTSHKIEQPQWFMETAWDVGKVLLTSAPKRDSSGQAWTTRYRFLWDDAEREKRMKSSWLQDQLQAQIPTILARYRGLPNVDEAALQDRIINTSLVLEERIKEVIGAVELIHSSYYTNAAVIRGIARFIATGKNESG